MEIIQVHALIATVIPFPRDTQNALFERETITQEPLSSLLEAQDVNRACTIGLLSGSPARENGLKFTTDLLVFLLFLLAP